MFDVYWVFEDGDTDHEYCKKYATFTHNNACEFILHIGSDLHEDDSFYANQLRRMKKGKCSKQFIKTYKKAAKRGATRVLFYC
jgi:hypothetical protein